MSVRRTTLGECCEIVSGATPSTSAVRYWDGDIEWATPKDLSDLDGKYISQTARRITKEGLASCAATLLPPNSVLFSSRAPIGHVAINVVPMATNQGFKSLVPRPNEVEPSFLYHWLRANRTYLESLGNGATFKEVSKAVVSRIAIYLPPIDEQRRIADILDKADNIRRKRKEAVALTEELKRSAFLEMFGDPVTNPKGWPLEPLGEITDAASGVTKGKRYDQQTLVTLPYMRVANVQDGHLVLDDVKTITVSQEDGRRYQLKYGEYALSHAAFTHIHCGDYVGASAVVDELVGLADEKGSLFWMASGMIHQGLLFALTGKAADAVHMVSSGITAYRSTGSTALLMQLSMPYLAKANADLGQFDDAWRCIGDATAAIETTTERWCESEVNRIAGKIALLSPEPDAAKAEAYFERALTVARAQQAKSWELRVAMSMARLWRNQGKRQQARDLLAPVYGWFTEGFDTLDLKDAKTLLDELHA